MTILAGLSILLPLAAAGISGARGVLQGGPGCVENLRKLTQAWHQFGTDHRYLPPNPDDGNATPGYNWVPGQAGRGGGHEFNSEILVDPSRSLLVPYLTDKDASLFRCPDDLRRGLYQGTNSQKFGTQVFAARSYAMNIAVGTNPYRTQAGTATDGAWLDNNHTHTRNKQWRTYGKLDDIIDPSPAKLAVLLDEDSASINDGCFAFGMAREEWIDWPGSRHNVGAAVSFADGHVEMRYWEDQRTIVSNGAVARREVVGSPDYKWLRDHVSAPFPLQRSVILIRPASAGAFEAKLAWPAKSGTNYRVEFSDDLKTWERLEAVVNASDGEATAVDPAPLTKGRRFYRLVPL